jgi:hypothetical protein
LRHFHRAAIRAAETRSRPLADDDAAHGLEHQLVHALVEYLSGGGAAEEETETTCRHRGIPARFEDLLQHEPFPDIGEICTALGISERTQCQCCEEHPHMGPGD